MNIILRYRALLWVVICSFVSNAHGQLWTEDFETNGLGEGQTPPPALQLFSANIPATDTSLQLRIYASCTATSEEFAFDYLRLYSTANSVAGCTNPNSSNFNVLATTDNRSCAYPVILEGCTYTGATNYDASANTDDGSCVFTTSSSCPEDINNDGFVGVSDLLQFIAAYGNSCN
jgi:hypothetical protein